MRERYFRVAWVTALFLLPLPFLGTWELTSDDGNTLFTAWRFLEAPFWFGHTTSVGMYHLSFPYAHLALALGPWGSPLTAQLCVLLTAAAAHWLLISAGERLRGFAAGYLASALAFAAPAFFPIYSQKLWEPCVLPLYTMLGLLALLEWERSGKGAWLAASCGAVLLAVGAHLNSLFLFAAVALVAWPRRRELRWPVLAACALFLAAAVSPFFSWHHSGMPTRNAPAGALLAAGAGLACLWLGTRAQGLVFSAALALLSLSFARAGAGENAPLVFADLLSPAARVATARTGAPESVFAFSWGIGGLLFAFFVAVAGLRLHREAGPRRVVFFWVAVPLLLALGEAIVLRKMAAHWLLFLFPAAWLAVADSLLAITARVARLARVPGAFVAGAAAAAVLVVMAWESARIVRFVDATGGIAVHMASLSVKQRVLDRISAEPGVPEIYQVRIPYGVGWEVDYEGWRWLSHQMARTSWVGRRGGGKFFYVHQEAGLASQPELLPHLRAAPGVREERIGSVTLFISDRPIEGGGVRLL